MPREPRALKRTLIIIGLGVALAAVAVMGLIFGPAEVSLAETWSALTGQHGDKATVSSVVVLDIRLPRVITGILVGAGLTVAGAMTQGLFRNPLADPALIGVSSGAAMGGVISIVLVPILAGTLALGETTLNYTTMLSTPVCAMAGAVGLTFFIYRISLVGGRTHVASMLLTGIAVNAISAAFVGLMVTVFATDAQLRSVTFWLLGSLAGASWQSATIMAVVI
ncbi:MAG: iron ABC transporter permease, partial [Verrucomicrobiota bacterium]